jgi:hypothetical protein
MPLSWIPQEPQVPPDQLARGRVHLRFEDVSQDGHMVVEAIPQALRSVWRALAKTRPALPPGLIAILSRVVSEVGEGPLAVDTAASAEGCYQLAHTIGPDGGVDKLVLLMWVRVVALVGRTHLPPPPDEGRTVVAGRVFAEHVFTRPFGPPSARKVKALDLGAGPFVPEARYAWHDPHELLAPPEGAAPLDPEPVLDEATTIFGLDHTDSNQHVNSLVYPRLFTEAALRRLHALGRSAPRLVRGVDIAFRKPCFAGQRARIASRAFAWEERAGITGALTVEGDAPGRPRCVARLVFDR